MIYGVKLGCESLSSLVKNPRWIESSDWKLWTAKRLIRRKEKS